MAARAFPKAAVQHGGLLRKSGHHTSNYSILTTQYYPMNETREFQAKLEALRREIARMPNLIATQAVNFSKERFRSQNWVGDTTQPWKARKPKSWGKETKRRSQRAVLTDKGRLRRSIRKISSSPDLIVIGTDVEYARAHNEGYRGKVTQTVDAHTRKRKGKVYNVKPHTRRVRMNLPQRQFLGASPVLKRQLERLITAAMITAIR